MLTNGRIYNQGTIINIFETRNFIQWPQAEYSVNG